ncbi:MAG TPA: phosphohydrolase [Firmicutes bacterium]|nr:phosphohydrolase [Bacillota bacterium]
MFYDSDPFFLEIVSEFLENPHYQQIDKFIAHGDWTVLDHSLNVASLCYEIGKRKGLELDYRSLIRAAMLHDFYCYDWHLPHKGKRLHGFRHPGFAIKEASKYFELSPFEKKLIHVHMFPLTFWRFPLSKEARLLVKCDHISALYEHKYRKNDRLRKRTLMQYAFGG